MDRLICIILCLVLIAVSVFALNACGDAMASIETEVVLVAEPTIVETTVAPTEETEPVVEETEPPAVETEPATEPPTEETQPEVALYDVPLSEDLQIYIIDLCEQNGIDPAIVIAMAWMESTYNPENVGDSGASIGLLQVQPRWHSARMEKLGCTDLFDPYQNVLIGVDYLVENIERYGDVAKALVAYNSGSYSGTITNYANAILEKAEILNNERSQ
jgi:soluble lytic murein transglycosylase-like protein